MCVRVPRADGKRGSRVFAAAATTAEILRLGESLLEQGIQMVTLESTSDYGASSTTCWRAAGCRCSWSTPGTSKCTGPPKTDKHDCVWLAKLTERGMLRPSFVPPQQVRVLRDYTRTRIDLTRDRTRQWQRLEKLLEDALVKITSVASTITTVSTRDMIEALIRGDRDPQWLADLARGTMRSKRADLVRALDGRFDDHHAELAQILLDQIDSLTTRIEQLIDTLPGPKQSADSGGPIGKPAPGHATATDTESPAPRSPLHRLADIPGISIEAAEVILAEIGTDMTRFPTPQHLVSWARLTPQVRQSGAKRHGGKVSKGNPYLKGVLGTAAASAARTNTFLGERYRRLVKRRGNGKALVAVARSILVIVWHLLANPDATFRDLGADFYTTRVDPERRKRGQFRQLEALSYTVTLQPAA